MSIQSPAPQSVAKPSQTTRNWIALSFIVSMALIGWAFAIGRREPDPALMSEAAVRQSLSQLKLPDDFVVRGASVVEIRDAMLAADHEFLRSLARRRAAEQRDLPGISETKIKWQQRSQRVRREAAQFENAEEGSIEWAYRQDLVESLKDGPL